MLPGCPSMLPVCLPSSCHRAQAAPGGGTRRTANNHHLLTGLLAGPSLLDPRCAARAWRQAPSLPSLVVNKITRYQFSTLMGFFLSTPKATFQLISNEFPLETWLCSWDCNDSRHDMLYYCLAVLQGGITSIAPGYAMITFLVCSSMFFGFLSSQKDLDLLRWKAK